MLGFSKLLESNFGDSATILTSPLEPRLKSGQDAATASSPPQYFDTPLGERRVPREKDPKKPNYEMIKDARRGILSGFLRSGKIFRASDFVGIVNPKTAIITLQDIYEFETRHLANIDDQPISRPPLTSIISFKKAADKGPDDEKTLRNLFFVTLAHDELPSFHFWTKPRDVDPVTAGKPIDWGKYFDQNPPSPAKTAKITMVENERKEKVQRGAEEQYNTQNEPQLGFLDDYNNVNLSGMGRKPTQAQPAGEVNSTAQTNEAPVLTRSPLEAEVLLQFNRGGMYLREFTHKALYAMACWLVENEEEDKEDDEEEQANKGSAGIKSMFLDILEPGDDLREERIVSVSRASNRNFQDNIRPAFGRPDNKFRIRSTTYQSWWNRGSGFDSGGVGDLRYDLKLVRPNVGFCYCSADWGISGKLILNSLRFEKALAFLFDWESSAYPKSDRLSLDIPGHGFFDINRNSDVVVTTNIQKIFHELSVGPDDHPVEIFIRDVVVDVTDESDFLGISSPGQWNTEHETGSREVPDPIRAPSGVGPLADQGPINASDLPNQAPSNVLGRLISGQHLGNGSIQATEIRGGPDFPSIHPRVLTNSEIHQLQERLKIAEASIVETDDLQEQLRTAKEKLSELNGLQGRLKTSEDRARLKSSCPFCPQDWAGVTKQQQQDHLKLHQRSIVHQPAPQECPQPGCKILLGENQIESTYEAISEHLRLHIEESYLKDGICEYQHCHANMYNLTAEQEEEHASLHHENQATQEECHRLRQQVRRLEKTLEKQDPLQEKAEDLESIVKERDHLQEQVSGFEHTAADHHQLQQQVKHLEDVTDQRDRLLETLQVTDHARNMWKDRVDQLERRLRAAPGLGEEMQAQEPESGTEVDEDLKQHSQPQSPKKLQYCNICLKSVDKLSANAKDKHADKCKTSISEILLITPLEAKVEREKRAQSHDVVRPQIHEGTEEVEAPDSGKRRKRKALSRAAPAKSKQDEVESANTAPGPEAGKAKSCKTPKRKLDVFKPSREDEPEDLESPKKKPKLKAKAAKANEKVTEHTRRSTRGKDIYVPPEEEEDEENHEGEASDVWSVKGGKRKKRVAATNTVSKKAKAKR